MSDYTAIADVSYTLADLLRNQMEDLIDPGSIAAVSPGEIEANDSVRLSLFLFQVIENVHMKNQEMQIINPAKLKYPPLILDLSYMLTSYPSSGIQDKTERTKDEHSVLGRAMQILHDNSIITDPFLRGCLTDDGQELHISQSLHNLGDMTKIWGTFQNRPFRPSVCYIVANVRIESTREKEAKRVISRRFDRYMKV
ncbi:MAG TPA: DUF4255 domain-containing protein [Methanosarcinaceae archaeon]|nr:DUF4255 domain-containing protein [Methanosarcinaceae archaeon]